MTINTPSAERLILQPITTKTATSTAFQRPAHPTFDRLHAIMHVAE